MTRLYHQLRRLGLPASRALVGARMLNGVRAVTLDDFEWVARVLRGMTAHQFEVMAGRWRRAA